MTEDTALKNGLDQAAVRAIAKQVRAVHPKLSIRKFSARANAGLEDLELKARVFHIAHALRPCLPEDPHAALDVLVATGQAWQRPKSDRYGFNAWPLIELAGEIGRPHPKQGLEALRQLTKLFSAEFAIRGFLADDPKRTFVVLRKWTRDDDHHVRRLVSEGTRPRLPWGLRVPALMQDPAPGLALLERLKDDPEEYVRRSVANHLNDVAKDHGDRVTEICGAWMKKPTDNRHKLVKHALRSLVKQGDTGALRVLGFDPKAPVRVSGLTLEPSRLKLGEALRFSFDVTSRGSADLPLVVDYALHHVKKAGHRTRKTFKLKTVTLSPKEKVSFSKKHAIKKISTRTYHSGRHALEILINGRSRGTVEFDLEV